VLQQIAAILSELDRPIPLVLIEARIVEINTDVVKDLGIQWGGNTASPTSKDRVGGAGGFSLSSTTGEIIPGVADRAFAINFPAALIPGGAGLGLGFSLGSLLKNFALDVQLTALETQGQAHILSRPKIVATDNFEAMIGGGSDCRVEGGEPAAQGQASCHQGWPDRSGRQYSKRRSDRHQHDSGYL
jgi:type IV pilus assembly protein PilQ